MQPVDTSMAKAIDSDLCASPLSRGVAKRATREHDNAVTIHREIRAQRLTKAPLAVIWLNSRTASKPGFSRKAGLRASSASTFAYFRVGTTSVSG
jgi:hypothetical protein